jgi:hypothetical protein
MVRRACIALAVAAGLVAAVPDRSSAVSSATPAEAARERQVAAACGDAQVRTTVLAGLAALVCVGFGPVATFRGRSTPA